MTNERLQDEIAIAEAEALADTIQETVAEGKISGSSILDKIRSGELMAESKFEASEEADTWVTLYNMSDGTGSTVPIYMARNFLRRRFPQENWIDKALWGKRVFTPNAHEAPELKPGTFKCRLHPESGEREFMDMIGLHGKSCNKSNITSGYEVEQHMSHRHRVELGTIERAEQRASTLEDKAATQALLERLVAVQENVEVKPTRGRPRKDNDAKEST